MSRPHCFVLKAWLESITEIEEQGSYCTTRLVKLEKVTGRKDDEHDDGGEIGAEDTKVVD